MKIDAKIRFEEKYLPTKRHRIPRIRTVEEDVAVELREVARKDAPVAMVVTDYQSYIDENGKDVFGLRDKAFLAVDGALYTEKRDMWGALDKGTYPMEDFLHALERQGDYYFCRSYNGETGRDAVLQCLQKFVDSHVMIDGVLYEESGEPRYLVQTFGLGHNHGGTGMFIETFYNPNISKDRYFTALQRDEAIACANEIATRRGDTKDVGTFGDINIEVYMPEMVRCNPQLEHGNGDPFLNSLNALTEGSGSVMEAGLLVMAATNSEIHKEDVPKKALEDVISAAENQKEAPARKTVEHNLGERE